MSQMVHLHQDKTLKRKVLEILAPVARLTSASSVNPVVRGFDHIWRIQESEYLGYLEDT